ncbi:gluconate 2-dehydrogenase subunit 3 family protein [Algoriphagus sediminis]|uniref:Gluconate 2-dehydrogenase subunit 3 family protein n=1 Tax=Algoriphagus sediminis TaxID=3057113 RepID=A0ABT7YHC2_9BACT|nr:gluconate 2-dehydrogenase subunit 3 family protein [Algoriphagus sediminis]MDN3205909.1 gluconate 2-dehydrogenase subunit 3 family protein [Algoriphagus sediminis]
MDRRKSLKILGGAAVGISGLIFADWKWQLIDQATHEGFFTLRQEQMLTAISDTIIPEGIPPKVPSSNSKPIGALSTGTDKFLIRLFEHCYESEDQELIKKQLDQLKSEGFLSAEKGKREEMLLSLSNSEDEEKTKFFDIIKSETIRGFTTAKEVMVDYRNYQLAPGMYKGCEDVNQQA